MRNTISTTQSKSLKSYTLVLERQDDQENVDPGHHLATALQHRGGNPMGLRMTWAFLDEAREAARWLAGKYTAQDGVLAVCVLGDNANGNVLLRAKVK